MKLLLACDEYCYIYAGKYYLSKTGIIFVERYLSVFEEVRFAVRTKVVENSMLIQKRVELSNPSVEIFEMPFFQGPKGFMRVFRSTLKVAQKACIGCDVAIFRLPSTVAFMVWHNWRKTGKVYGTEIVFDCYDAIESSKSYTEKILWRQLHQWQTEACRDADGVACVTREYLQRRYFPSKPDAITANYSSIELTPDFYYHPRTFPEKEAFTIIHVANQVQYNGRKGHCQILEAMAKLKKAGIQVNVVFVGENYQDGIGKLRKYADNLSISCQLRFTGFINTEQLREELIGADLAVLPTKAEGLPRVVIEAMATGLPCITSPVSGNTELIDKNWLIEYYDVDHLAAAIKRLITDRSEYESQSRTNFERSKEYSSGILNSRRTEFYKSLKNRIPFQ